MSQDMEGQLLWLQSSKPGGYCPSKEIEAIPGDPLYPVPVTERLIHLCKGSLSFLLALEGSQGLLHPAQWSLLLEAGGGGTPSLPPPSTVQVQRSDALQFGALASFVAWCWGVLSRGLRAQKCSIRLDAALNLQSLRSFSYYMTQQMLAVMRWIMMLSYQLGKKKDGTSGQETHMLLLY